MNTKVRVQLLTMMFFQFFIWGTWFVALGTYLGQTLKYSDQHIGNVYGALWWGAIIAPIFIGVIADRFFAAEKVLGVLQIGGGVVLYLASLITDPATFFWAVVVYAVFYMPTLALVNAVAFHQMSDPGKQFPAVRVAGTIGWIVAGIAVSVLKLEPTPTPMVIAAGISIAFGLFCFTLPSTPPKAKGQKVSMRQVLSLDALVLMKNRSFAVLVIASMLICIPLAFYYNYANLMLSELKIGYPTALQAAGQGSEVLFMLAMPLLLARVGIKTTMLIGMLAWSARYVLFATGASGPVITLLVGGILLHGICYDFFFVSGQIYVDKHAPKGIRASAQGLITLATYGVGLTAGSFISGAIVESYNRDWTSLWYAPAAMALVVAVPFAFIFKDDRKGVEASAKASDNQPVSAGA